MNSGSSAFIFSGLQSAGTWAASSWYQTSRPGVIATWPPVRRTTRTFSLPAQRFSASSVLTLSGTLRPPRRPSSAVMTSLELASLMRLASESGEKPPKTIECTAPMRVQASMA